MKDRKLDEILVNVLSVKLDNTTTLISNAA
jgi:hypothetical protein